MSDKTVTISENTARILLRTLEEVCGANDRARCSDAYFRQHFLMLIKDSFVSEARAQLEAAYLAAITHQ